MNIKSLIKEAHENAVAHGFDTAKKDVGMMLALMHSEISEALEDYRNHYGLDEIYYECKKPNTSPEDCTQFCPSCEFAKPCGIPIELADIVIRVLDFCGAHNIDLENAIAMKMAYNKTRPHLHGGKRV